MPQGRPRGLPALLSPGEPRCEVRATATVRSELAAHTALWWARKDPTVAVWLLPWAGALLLGGSVGPLPPQLVLPGQAALLGLRRKS